MYTVFSVIWFFFHSQRFMAWGKRGGWTWRRRT